MKPLPCALALSLLISLLISLSPAVPPPASPSVAPAAGVQDIEVPDPGMPGAENPGTANPGTLHPDAANPDAVAPESTVPDIPTIQPSSKEGEPVTYPARLPVLMYHHVVPDGETCNDVTITAGRLEQDFQWLNENGYHTVLPRELAAGQPLPEKAVLVTFDDGYRSNYELAYPLLQKYRIKAVIAIMVRMQDRGAESFLSWDMCREMDASGLVEIGSHGYATHNLDERQGSTVPGRANGVEREKGESDEAFKSRVLDDLQMSYDRIAAEVGTAPSYFAYPFGRTDPGADAFLKTLFPVTAVTATGKTADLSQGLLKLGRFNMSMKTRPSQFC